MTKYLYGASVQGIQDFITQTGRLKEIVGASEIVEKICTEDFYECANINDGEANLIRAAAGNIRYVFDTKEECALIVKGFPKTIMEKAPGIRISQAVVTFENGGLADALERIERALQEQRNRIPRPMEIGFMGLERSRRSGNVAVRFEDKEAICSSIDAKLKESGGKRLLRSLTDVEQPDPQDFEIQIDKMVLGDGNRWVAVIHADGNGMGAIVQALGKRLRNEPDDLVKCVFREFSQTIDKCTKKAVQSAFRHVEMSSKRGRDRDRRVTCPIRPLVIGGDDLTIVMRADLAFDFTSRYLKAFEEETQTGFRELFDAHKLDLDISPRLTVCAGIAYVGDSYPFHYASNLAEALCKEAKESSKEIAAKSGPSPSSLSFYKVQDSFIETGLKRIRERTQRTPFGVCFDYGPYFLEPQNGKASISDMQSKLATLKEMDKGETSASLSKLRKWVTESYRNEKSADFMMDRIKQIEDERTGVGMYQSLDLKDHRSGRSIIMEMLQLHGFNQ